MECNRLTVDRQVKVEGVRMTPEKPLQAENCNSRVQGYMATLVLMVPRWRLCHRSPLRGTWQLLKHRCRWRHGRWGQCDSTASNGRQRELCNSSGDAYISTSVKMGLSAAMLHDLAVSRGSCQRQS